MRKVLIISDGESPEESAVIHELRAKDVDVVLFSLQELSDDLVLCGYLGSGTLPAGIRTRDRFTSLTDVGFVWFRKRSPIVIKSDQMSYIDKLHAEAQFDALVLSLPSLTPHAIWHVTPLESVRLNLPAIQISEAQRCGLRVPVTALGNDAVGFGALAESAGKVTAKPVSGTDLPAQRYAHFLPHLRTLLMKYLGRNSRLSQEYLFSVLEAMELEFKLARPRAVPTAELSASFLADIDLVGRSPILLQESVDARADLWILIVGDDAFAFFRPSGTDEPWSTFELRANLSQSLLKLRDALGVNMGVFQFVMDLEGELFFTGFTHDGAWIVPSADAFSQMASSVARWIHASLSQGAHTCSR